MIYLVLYDSRGQCQYVATASILDAPAFVQAGFTQVDQAEYERCAELVDTATRDDLPRINQARQLVQQIGTQGNIVRIVEPNLDALERLTNQQVARFQTLTQQRIDGDLTESRWYREMGNTINAGNIAASAIAKGGIQYLDSQDYQQIEQDNEIHYGYLTKYRREFTDLSSAQVLDRSGLYGGAVTGRYWKAFTKSLGMPPLPAMPSILCTCKNRCKCHWNFIQLPGQGNWDCQWRVTENVIHCDECSQRQRTFNPLQIRNGIVQPFNPNGIYA